MGRLGRGRGFKSKEGVAIPYFGLRTQAALAKPPQSWHYYPKP